MIKQFIKSVKCAVFGIVFCVRNERNMRIHLVASAYIFILGVFFKLSQTQFLILLLAVVANIMAETFNTSIEELVDLVQPSYNHMARVAKDVAAGAVLVCSLTAAVIVIVFFRDFGRWLELFKAFIRYPVLIVLFIVSLILSLAFIFIGPQQTRAVMRSLRNRNNGK